jgi:hypothetical protein
MNYATTSLSNGNNVDMFTPVESLMKMTDKLFGAMSGDKILTRCVVPVTDASASALEDVVNQRRESRRGAD